MKLMYLYAIVLMMYSSLAYNLDTTHPKIFKGNNASYFGFSVAFQRSENGDIKILVSAPRSNTSYYGDILEPGVIYSCRTKDGQCDEVILDIPRNRARVDLVSNRPYRDGRNNMWMGSSIASQNRYPWNAVVCGHRWYEIFDDERSYNPIMGVCYVIPPTHNQDDITKLIPMLSGMSIDGRHFATIFGQSGTSSAFGEDGETILLGSPGIHRGLGGVAAYQNDLRNPPKIQYPGSVISVTERRLYSDMDYYAGYSVTSAYFYDSGLLAVALGAPKAHIGYGKVYIGYLNIKNSKKMIPVDNIDGLQCGSYFGASLLSIHLNTDKLSDLLIGAPLYSTQWGGDEGRVYIYHSTGKEMRFMYYLEGRSSGSRFGTAIANAGDINLDGLNDVVIGAPYEQDGVGAVYIYHGSSSKLQLAQRISPLESWKMKGFGRSLAWSVDIDGNFYPDFLIGAYESDHAVLLRSQPIVALRGRIEFSLGQIDLDGPSNNCALKSEKVTCFTVTGCVTASGKHLPEQINISIRIEIDPPGEGIGTLVSRRGNFIVNGTAKHVVQRIIQINLKEKCIHEDVYITKQPNQDYTTPVLFNLTFHISGPEQTKEFCSDCPVMNPALPRYVIRRIPFATGCGDNDCEPDFLLKAEILNLGEGDPLTLGQNNSITLRVEMWNSGENAYLAKWRLVIPGQLLLSRQKTDCRTIGKPRGQSDYEIECDLGNPMKRSKDPVVALTYLDTTQLPNTLELITLTMDMKTTGRIVKPESAKKTLNIFLRVETDITIDGVADYPETVFNSYKDIVPVNHRYEVTKYGPSPLNTLRIEVLVPVYHNPTKKQFLMIDSVQLSDGLVSGRCNYSSVGISGEASARREEEEWNPTFNSSPSDYYIPDQPGGDIPFDFNVPTASTPQGSVSDGTLNCHTAICMVIICTAGPFRSPEDRVAVVIEAKLNMSVIQQTMGIMNKISIISEGNVQIEDNLIDPQPKNERKDKDKVELIFQYNAPLHAIPLANWIIPVSVGGGFLLLVIIILLLVQVGFFRRRKHEEIQSLLQSGHLVKQVKGQPEITEDIENE